MLKFGLRIIYPFQKMTHDLHHVVTQEQVDKLRDEFDNNIYPKATAFFGTPDVHDGSKSPLAGRNVPAGYYEGSDKIIMLVDNIQDDNFNRPNLSILCSWFLSGKH